MGEIFAAMTTVNVPVDLKMSEGRELANEQLMKAIPSKETRDFVLMNLVKGSDGRLMMVAYCMEYSMKFLLTFTDSAGEPMLTHYIKISTITFRNSRRV